MNLDTILTKESLYSPCEKCGRSGKINSPALDDSMYSVSHPLGANEVTCPDCDGMGLKLTPAGEVLQGFIKELIKDKDLLK